MLILVSGLIGAGKSTIARELALRLKVPYYDVDETKKTVYRDDPDYEKNMREGIPFSDATREKVFAALIADLRRMQEDHDHVVIDETLHKRALRSRLYAAADEIFGGFIVIWVRADDEVIRDRLGSTKREGHILNDPIPMYEAFKREFEEFRRSVIICPNNERAEDSVTDLVNLLRASATLTTKRGVETTP